MRVQFAVECVSSLNRNSQHAGEKTAIVRGYEGELSLENKSRILEAIPFGIELASFKGIGF